MQSGRLTAIEVVVALDRVIRLHNEHPYVTLLSMRADIARLAGDHNKKHLLVKT